MLNKLIRFFLENKLVTFLMLFIFIAWGIVSAPFNWETGMFPRDPVPVDAIPDIGENQQIVYTEWAGRSPQDIEDQISYPLTTALLGIPGVKDIRSNSIFGLSSIYLIFEEDVEFYWSRTRILEKLNSLPSGTLPEDVTPALGPDATALGQVYWYTLEGRDKDGNPAGGWDPHELRTIQDFYVRYSLTSAKGIAEVASIGGFVKEYQVDIDPNAMRAHGITVAQIMEAVKKEGLAKKTLMVFISDNGGPVNSNGSINAPLNGQKGILLEGGIRVPFIMHWQGKLPARKTYNNPVISLDFAATFIEEAGGIITKEDKLDGVNLLPYLTGKMNTRPHEELNWRFTISAAIREGDWKLIRLPDRLPMLYYLPDDISEQNNVARQNPEQTKKMLKNLGQWDVGLPHPVFLEGAEYKSMQLDLYDSKYPLVQPD